MIAKMSKKGFTLVELLVVISIIALLLSILMPSLSKVREQAKAVICASNQKQTGLILFLYAQENKYAITEPVLWSKLYDKRSFYVWGDRMFYEFKYIQSTEHLYCPSSKIPDGCTKKWNPSLTATDFRKSDPFKWSSLWTFGLRTPDFGVNIGGNRTNEPIKLNNLKRPSAYYLLTDTSIIQNNIGQKVASQKFQYYVFDAYSYFFMLHSKGANILMADGSVSQKKEREISNDIRSGVIGPFYDRNNPFVYPDGKTGGLK
jgi:prepilin-type N-terminal cleavage/methylation domain-containing protein/prepilin-type processing-associated H-X9-DG protein